MKTLSSPSDHDSHELAPAGVDKSLELAMPDTRRLAASVAKLPECGDDKEHQISVRRFAAYRDMPAYVDVKLQQNGKKICIVVGCPKEGAELNRITLWNDDRWDIALLTSAMGFDPHNHGFTQAHIDELTSHIDRIAEQLNREAPPALPAAHRLLGDGARRVLGEDR